MFDQNERDAVDALIASFDEYATRQSVKGTVRAYMELQRRVDALRSLACAEAPGEQAHDPETTYYLELYGPDPDESWTIAGCGYDTEDPEAALGMLDWLSDHRRRLVRVDSQFTVVEERDAEVET
jgi:hypothetical protein